MSVLKKLSQMFSGPDSKKQEAVETVSEAQSRRIPKVLLPRSRRSVAE